MFEGLMERVRAKAARRVEARVLELCEREAPRGVSIEATSEGVTLSGRGLRRRVVTEAALRWLLR